MRIKSLFIYSLIVGGGLVSSCKDDEVPNQQIDLNGKTFSLKGANLYLIDQYIADGREFLTYAISDGTYINSSGCHGLCLDDYDDETYFFSFILGSFVNGEVVLGKYRMHLDLDVPPQDEKMCYIRMDYQDTTTPGYIYLESIRSNANEPSPFIITGGLEGGQKMTIKFSGNLILFSNSPYGSLPLKSSIYYSGSVIDAR
jgi:hypothetical protein